MISFHSDLWETQCIHEMVTLREYAEWGQQKEDPTNPLSHYDPKEYSCYIDYKYMKDIASDEIMKVISYFLACFWQFWFIYQVHIIFSSLRGPCTALYSVRLRNWNENPSDPSKTHFGILFYSLVFYLGRGLGGVRVSWSRRRREHSMDWHRRLLY